MSAEPTLPVSQPDAKEWLSSRGLADLSLYWPTDKPIPKIDYESGEAQPTLTQLMDAFAAERDRELQQARGELSDLTALLPSRDKQSFEAGFEAGKELFELELQQAREEIAAYEAMKEGATVRIHRAEQSLSEAREELARLKDGMHQVILVLSSKGDAPQSKAIKMLADLKTWIPEKPDTK